MGACLNQDCYLKTCLLLTDKRGGEFGSKLSLVVKRVRDVAIFACKLHVKSWNDYL